MKVLIIDDQVELATMLKNLLVNRNYADTTSVLSGQQALEAFKTNSYNLVICDYDMPEMNGHDVFLALCSHGYDCLFLLYTNAELTALPKFEGSGFLGVVNKKELPKLFDLLKTVADKFHSLIS